jgi:hypothetical protein
MLFVSDTMIEQQQHNATTALPLKTSCLKQCCGVILGLYKAGSSVLEALVLSLDRCVTRLFQLIEVSFTPRNQYLQAS